MAEAGEVEEEPVVAHEHREEHEGSHNLDGGTGGLSEEGPEDGRDDKRTWPWSTP